MQRWDGTRPVRRLRHLLAAGRCVSTIREAAGAIRVQPPAYAMSEAAGTAAALACRSRVAFRAVSVPDLQGQLVRQGAFLGTRYDGMNRR